MDKFFLVRLFLPLFVACAIDHQHWTSIGQALDRENTEHARVCARLYATKRDDLAIDVHDARFGTRARLRLESDGLNAVEAHAGFAHVLASWHCQEHIECLAAPGSAHTDTWQAVAV